MIKYIDNDVQKGIKYDWNKIMKRVSDLKIPVDYFDPSKRPVDLYSWIIMLSERATGKTTGLLLMGLVMYRMYGTVTIYCRANKNQIAPKHTTDLYNVVISNGYIEKITDGEYNSIKYNRRKWYLCHIDDTGEIDAVDNNACCHMLAVGETLEIKSGLNLPTGDIIIFDEFVTPAGYTSSNEFVMFCDLVSTVFRLRECGKIFLLGNTINKFSQYYDDLEISEIIRGMDIGDIREVRGRGKTPIYIEIVKPSADFKVKKKSWVERFMGFAKPELSSITGRAVWAVNNYPHIPDNKYYYISNRFYIYHTGRYARLEIVSNEELGVCIYIHWASKIYPDSIILTTGEIDSHQKHYYLGNPLLESFIGRIKRAGKIFFASNDVGSFFDNYMQSK